MQQQAAQAGMQPNAYMGGAPVFYPPGQQPGFLPPGGRGMPFPPQPGMMPQGMPQGGPGGRGPQGGNFPPNGGRGPQLMPQGMPPQGMYGPPTMGPGGGPGGPGFPPYPNAQALAAAQAQAVAATGRGRGGMPPAGMPGVPPQGMPMGMGPRGPAPTGRGAPRSNVPPQQQAPRQPIPAPQQVMPTTSSIDIAAFTLRPHGDQKQILGESLYPKIMKQHPELAGKITGMLLEMDNMELLALFVSQYPHHCILNSNPRLQT